MERYIYSCCLDLRFDTYTLTVILIYRTRVLKFRIDPWRWMAICNRIQRTISPKTARIFRNDAHCFKSRCLNQLLNYYWHKQPHLIQSVPVNSTRIHAIEGKFPSTLEEVPRAGRIHICSGFAARVSRQGPKISNPNSMSPSQDH